MLTVLSCLVSCGSDGKNGLDGISKTGGDGKNAINCFIDNREDGDYIVCPDSEVKIVEGVDGQDGQDGDFDGYIDLVEVCPLISGNYKETLIHLDGEYLAFLTSSNHVKQRLILLKEDVTYKTTDGRNVSFKISEGELICL